MLFLLFHIGKDRYALEARNVVEVVPLLEPRKIPHSPPGLAGLVNYRGQAVPAVDLSFLALGTPAVEKLSTRIIILRCVDETGQPKLVGLIAEQTTEVFRGNPEEFVFTGLEPSARPFDGPVLMAPEGPIQLISGDKLIQHSVRKLALELAPTAAS